jgi:hypothetical protein
MSDQLFRQAQKLVRQGQLDEARGLLLRYVEQEENNELAWLLLSDLVESSEDKQIALENALTINPNLVRAQNRLLQLRGERQQTIEEKFKQGETAVKVGLRVEAMRLLQEVVQAEPHHEQAWLLLSQIVTAVEDKIVALEFAQRANPRNDQTTHQLAQLRQNHGSDLAVGAAYAAQGEVQKALDAYAFAAGHAPVAADRLIAQKKLEELRQQTGQKEIKVTSPTMTLLRFMVGPPLIYTILSLIQSGLSLNQLPPRFLWELLAVWFGTVLFIAANQKPHTGEETLFGPDILEDARLRNLLTLLGLVLVLVPFLFFLWGGAGRLLLWKTAVFP